MYLYKDEIIMEIKKSLILNHSKFCTDNTPNLCIDNLT